MPKRLLIIGLDGVSWNVLNPMIENGYMPFLKEFTHTGKSGILESTDPPITPAAWTSFQTGLRPEEHSVRGFRNFQLINGKLTYELNNSTHIRHKNIWQILSGYNKRVCAINIPLTYPPFKVNGIVVSGFPIPSKGDFTYSYPTDLAKEILKEIPDYRPIKWGDGIEGFHQGDEFFIERMIHMSSLRAQLSLYLLNKEDWDVFMVHFQETDFLQHRFWHYIDKEHPNFTSEGFKKCAKYYNNLDQKLSQIAASARKKDFSMMFMSDHGFQRLEYDIKINNWLHSKKLLYVHKSLKTIAIPIVKNIGKLFPQNFKKYINREGAKAGITKRYLEKSIDYKRSLLFVETNATHVAYIHFIKNVSEEIKNRVIKQLLGLTSPDGKKLIVEILPYQNSTNSYKILFENGVVATGTMVTKEPWCSKPVVGKRKTIGIHHKDGVLITDSSFKGHKLPEKIYEVFYLILNHQGIKSVPKSTSNDMSIETLNDNEQAEIEKCLSDLGYL